MNRVKSVKYFFHFHFLLIKMFSWLYLRLLLGGWECWESSLVVDIWWCTFTSGCRSCARWHGCTFHWGWYVFITNYVVRACCRFCWRGWKVWKRAFRCIVFIFSNLNLILRNEKFYIFTFCALQLATTSTGIKVSDKCVVKNNLVEWVEFEEQYSHLIVKPAKLLVHHCLLHLEYSKKRKDGDELIKK